MIWVWFEICENDECEIVVKCNSIFESDDYGKEMYFILF